MGSIKKLNELVAELETLDNQSTIYVEKPWIENSNAMLLYEPDSGELPTEAMEANLKYFLEVSIAQDFMKEWSKNLVTKPSLQQKCSRLIQYAVNDS